MRILYAGTVSYQKGMHDMLGVLRALGSRMKFRLVGPLARECHAFAREAARYCTVDGALPERQLAAAYAWGDVFLLPTLQDGFAVVLAQAQAAGLPILTTSNSGGPDIIAGGGQGWVVPIRAPEEIIARLEWCDAHRGEIAAMVEALHEAPPRRGWDDVARDFLMAVST